MDSEELGDFYVRRQRLGRLTNGRIEKMIPSFQKRSFDLRPNYIPYTELDSLDELENLPPKSNGPTFMPNISNKFLKTGMEYMQDN